MPPTANADTPANTTPTRRFCSVAINPAAATLIGAGLTLAVMFAVVVLG